jgi:hypothetical protein
LVLYIEDKNHYRSYIVTQAKGIAKMKGHDIKKDKFFYKSTVGVGDRGVFYSFAYTTNICK